MTERKVYFNISHGRYDLCSNEKEWLVSLHTPFGNIREFFKEEPDCGSSVEDVLDVIERRVESYWMSSTRAENRATIANIKANLTECELLFAQGRLDRLRAQEERVQKDIASVERLIAALREEIAEKA